MFQGAARVYFLVQTVFFFNGNVTPLIHKEQKKENTIA